MKQFVMSCWNRNGVKRGLKICGALLALYFIGVAAICVEVLLVDGVPEIAAHKAKVAERKRAADFLIATANSAHMAMESCPSVWDDSFFSFFSRAESRGLSSLSYGQSGWVPVCRMMTGYHVIDDPWSMCQWLNRVIRIKEKAPANKMDNGEGYYLLCGHQVRCNNEGQIDGAGQTCVSGDKSYPPFQPKHEVYSSILYNDEEGQQNALMIPNIRLKVEQCSDALKGHQHCTATIWVAQERRSWGSYLVAEYTSSLRRLVAGIVLLLALGITCLVFTMWRIIIVSARRDPNSSVPWVIQVPLESAALDHETDFHLNNVLDDYEENFANRGVWKWLFLLRMPQNLAFLISRRVAFLAQRCVCAAMTGSRRAWAATARLLF